MARKTFEVKSFLKQANDMLLSEMTTEAKSAVCSMIERVLLDTDNYKGFRFLDHVNALEVAFGDPDFYDRQYF